MTRVSARLRTWLAQPVDGASLTLFRICFGLVIVWEALRYLWPRPGGNWLHVCFVDTGWNFPYPGFAWVRPWPEPFLTLHFIVLGLCGLLVAMGLFYRVAIVAVFFLFTYVFLLEEAFFLNHFYLMCLLAFLMTLMPAQTCFSLDRFRLRPAQRGDAPLDSIPFWPVFLLRAQMFMVYFFAGVAKLSGDWVSGTPLHPVGQRIHAFLSGWLPGSLDGLGIARFMAVGGLGFDLSVGFLLIFRRTRLLGLLLAVMFHVTNSQMFDIGSFPALGVAATLIFCEPDWPRRVWRWLCRPHVAGPDWRWLVPGALVLPGIGALLGWKVPAAVPRDCRKPAPVASYLLAFVALWLTVHALLPLRHLVIGPNSTWTDEGAWFSWRMMVRLKDAHVQFTLVDPALYAIAADGGTQFNWPEWTRKYTRTVYRPIDALHLDGEHLPPLFVVFDPLLGERIVWNPGATAPDDMAAAQQRLQGQWHATYGRLPMVTPAVSVTEVFDGLVRELERTATYTGPEGALFRSRLESARRLAAQPRDAASDPETRAATLDDLVDLLLDDKAFGPVVFRHLARTAPLALQGAPPDGRSWFIVADRGLQTFDKQNRLMLDRSRWKGAQVVLLDVARMKPSVWVSLPEALVVDQGGFPYIVWNPHAELSFLQTGQMFQDPGLIYHYAQHIAQRWTTAFGRRPQVYATASPVALNDRAPQTMIDPRVDLAAAPRKLFQHNDWILPLRDDPDALCLAPLDGTPNAQGHVGPERVVQRYPNGQEQCAQSTVQRGGQTITTTVTWYENGLPSSRVEACAETRSMGLTQWHPTGHLAKQSSVQDGKLAGPATLWYPDGHKAWEGVFVAGHLQELTTTMVGDASQKRP